MLGIDLAPYDTKAGISHCFLGVEVASPRTELPVIFMSI